mmetsp:Transcript_25136/g.59965  ORF Transcript_25136/g.59965 Transcript_25136/m.59965 type:complete len:204 (-) Transcript_25136:1698-2309(-)
MRNCPEMMVPAHTHRDVMPSKKPMGPRLCQMSITTVAASTDEFSFIFVSTVSAGWDTIVLPTPATAPDINDTVSERNVVEPMTGNVAKIHDASRSNTRNFTMPNNTWRVTRNAKPSYSPRKKPSSSTIFMATANPPPPSANPGFETMRMRVTSAGHTARHAMIVADDAAARTRGTWNTASFASPTAEMNIRLNISYPGYTVTP